MNKTLHAIGLIFAFIAATSQAQVPSAQVTLNVVSIDHDPVAGAKVGMGGGLNTPDAEYPRKANGETDADGNFTATIGSSMGMLSFFAEKTGYYATEATGIRLYSSESEMAEAKKNGRWKLRAKQLTVVLKPIKNPVPMYVKRLDVLVPEVGKPVGYDLEKGDWVAPYGIGARSDFEFTVEGRYESKRDYEGMLTLRLPGEGNGIQAYELDPVQRSELKLPYEAPESGYQATWVWHNSRKTPVTSQPSVFVDESNGMRAFIYRVRTVLDPQGRVIRANYGKIHGPVYFQTFEQGKSRVGFTYYYNPDETKNLECDPKRNLFPNQQEGVEP